MPGQELAVRLRLLRTKRWPGYKLTLKELAKVFGTSISLIASWESTTKLTVPTVARLDDYARFFCTRRSVADGVHRFIPVDELNEAERAEMELLRGELLSLRGKALGASPDPGSMEELLRFPDGNAVAVIVAEVPDAVGLPPLYSDPQSPDYIEAYRYADLDSLIELYAYLRAANPSTAVNRRTHKMIGPNDLTDHIVLLGGSDWNDVTKVTLDQLAMPIVLVNDWDTPEGPYFEVEGRRYHRKLDDSDALVADVVLLYRGPNPHNRKRTVTIIAGMYGRGNLGTIQAFTDRKFRDRNNQYLSERFKSDAAFCLLLRVTVVNNMVVTPDLTLEASRLYEWPPRS